LSASEAKYGEFTNLAFEMQQDFPNNMMGLTHINQMNFFVPHVHPYRDYFGTTMQALAGAFFDPSASHGLNDKQKVEMMKSHCMAILATESCKDYRSGRLKFYKDQM
jgi:hypothetical protein